MAKLIGSFIKKLTGPADCWKNVYNYFDIIMSLLQTFIQKFNTLGEPTTNELITNRNNLYIMNIITWPFRDTRTSTSSSLYLLVSTKDVYMYFSIELSSNKFFWCFLYSSINSLMTRSSARGSLASQFTRLCKKYNAFFLLMNVILSSHSLAESHAPPFSVTWLPLVMFLPLALLYSEYDMLGEFSGFT